MKTKEYICDKVNEKCPKWCRHNKKHAPIKPPHMKNENIFCTDMIESHCAYGMGQRSCVEVK